MVHASERRSQLFTLRVWPEELVDGNIEWRGKIQRVVGGETLYFHDWQAMMSFLLMTLGAAGADREGDGEEEPR